MYFASVFTFLARLYRQSFVWSFSYTCPKVEIPVVTSLYGIVRKMAWETECLRESPVVMLEMLVVHLLKRGEILKILMKPDKVYLAFLY